MDLELIVVIAALVFASTLLAIVGEHIARQLAALVDVLALPVDERSPRRQQGQLYGRDPQGRGRQ